ncbi:MAG: sterol desaturase family protein [Bacteroidia bacterium]|nr:sterol desaturase family protein [Bacteroidia bacterium]
MNYPDLSDPIIFLGASIMVSLVVFFRYVLIAGGFYLFFYVFRIKQYEQRKLSKRLREKNQSRKEILWSFWTSLVFGVSGAFMLWAWQKGYTQIYFDISEHPLYLLPLSFFGTMLIHETYYYWLHRWMHKPSVYKLIHRVHHDSIVTSPWTSFSFHPWESVLQSIVVPSLVFIYPMHVSVVLLLLTTMTLTSCINHLDIEIYPKGFDKHWLGKWLIGATHHSLHHSQFRFNYGLYFTFWDKWMDTESPHYHKRFKEKTEEGSKEKLAKV